jgi:hypothetical protein
MSANPEDVPFVLVFPSEPAAGEGGQLKGDEIDEDGWTHELMLTSDPVPNPMPWYDITEHLLIEGLAPVVGAPEWDSTSSGFYSGGTRVVHKPTIEAIFRLLGLN